VSKQQLDQLMREIDDNQGVQFVVDLESQQVTTPAGNGFSFEVDPFRKTNLLGGLDDIANTLKHVDQIDAYEVQHKQLYPWLWT
jgi:3-isopropylmalate/(R)-2-methylmalate dehydratase small subunit